MKVNTFCLSIGNLVVVCYISQNLMVATFVFYKYYSAVTTYPTSDL